MAKKSKPAAPPASKPAPTTPHHVKVASQAAKDLGKPDKAAWDKVADGLRTDLTANTHPDKLDVKALKGASPWLRLRVGDHRIVYRPLTPVELAPLVAPVPAKARPMSGYVVERIVNRRDLDKAVGGL